MIDRKVDLAATAYRVDRTRILSRINDARHSERRERRWRRMGSWAFAALSCSPAAVGFFRFGAGSKAALESWSPMQCREVTTGNAPKSPSMIGLWRRASRNGRGFEGEHNGRGWLADRARSERASRWIDCKREPRASAAERRGCCAVLTRALASVPGAHDRCHDRRSGNCIHGQRRRPSSLDTREVQEGEVMVRHARVKRECMRPGLGRAPCPRPPPARQRRVSAAPMASSAAPSLGPCLSASGAQRRVAR